MSQQATLFTQRALRIAYACAIVPMVTGISIYLLWLITDWDALEMVGLYTIVFGFAFFVMGMVALLAALYVARKIPGLDRKAFNNRAWMAAGLLFVNFPICISITAAASYSMSAYRLTLDNQSGEDLHNLKITGGGTEESIPSLPSGKSVKRTLHFQQEGALTLQLGPKVAPILIDGYVDPVSFGRNEVVIHPGGKVSTPRIPTE